MSMSERSDQVQDDLWVRPQELQAPANSFYERLNEVLREADFDPFVEELCRPYYAEGKGRPSIPPGVYFRMILLGYFEGIASERGICWRVSDSLSLRRFVGLGLEDRVPERSSLSRIRQRLGLEVSVRMFDRVLAILQEEGLVKGRRLGVDATSLESAASMRSIRRKVDGRSYREYAKQQAREAGEEPEDP